MKVNWQKETTLSVETAIEKVTAELLKEGFGILTRIDLHSKMNEKLGKNLPVTVVLGACQPQLAYEAVMINSDVMSLLPCNVVVRAVDSSKVMIEFARATPILSLLADERLNAVAKEADARLLRAFERI